jgi:hypothetical protein
MRTAPSHSVAKEPTLTIWNSVSLVQKTTGRGSAGIAALSNNQTFRAE